MLPTHQEQTPIKRPALSNQTAESASSRALRKNHTKMPTVIMHGGFPARPLIRPFPRDQNTGHRTLLRDEPRSQRKLGFLLSETRHANSQRRQPVPHKTLPVGGVQNNLPSRWMRRRSGTTPARPTISANATRATHLLPSMPPIWVSRLARRGLDGKTAEVSFQVGAALSIGPIRPGHAGHNREGRVAKHKTRYCHVTQASSRGLGCPDH